MKKVFAILAAAITAAMLTGCTFDTQIYSKTYTVAPEEWKTLDGDAIDTYLYVTFTDDNITESVINYGTVAVNLYLPTQKTWTSLPYVIPYEYNITDDKTGDVLGTTTTTEVFRYEWGVGEITFILQDMDGALPAPLTEEVTFRVSTLR